MIYQFLAASIILTLMPGPDILYVLAISLERGARQGVAVALGLCSGLIFHTTAVVLGVAVVIANSPTLFMVIKYLGVAYLTYLGISTIVAAKRRSAGRIDTEKVNTDQNARTGTKITSEAAEIPESTSGQPEDMTGCKYYKRGVTMNILNPKVVLFFLSFLPGFIDPASDNPALDTIILGGVFAAQALVVFSLIAVLGSVAGRSLHIDRYTGSFGFAVASACVYFALAIFISVGPAPSVGR